MPTRLRSDNFGARSTCVTTMPNRRSDAPSIDCWSEVSQSTSCSALFTMAQFVRTAAEGTRNSP